MSLTKGHNFSMRISPLSLRDLRLRLLCRTFFTILPARSYSTHCFPARGKKIKYLELEISEGVFEVTHWDILIEKVFY